MQNTPHKPVNLDSSANCKSTPGDAQEPEQVKDQSFDPAILGQPTVGVTPAADPFDPAALRLCQDLSAATGVKKVLLSVPVRKPDPIWFVRAHPDEAYRLQTAVIELKADREMYLVARPLRPELSTEATFKPKMLVTAISRQGDVFLWELNLPRADGRADEWSRTALEAVDLAKKSWVRVVANVRLGGYEVHQATGHLPAPEWPGVPFKDLLKLAFKDKYIDRLDHPILRKLRGEV
jgi:hypothetical protein